MNEATPLVADDGRKPGRAGGPPAGPRPPPLSAPGEGAPAPVCDFTGGALAHRLRQGFGRKDPLARAVGAEKGPSVVDATAGLGRDAFLLASLGLEVTLIERAPAVQAALAEGLRRARAAGPPAEAIAARMTLVMGDARDHLPRLRPDVVLVDPMHPPRTKSALVKQPLRDLRAVVGADPDAAELLRVALGAARRRVVLKWPLRAVLPDGLPPPHHAILTRTLRFVVFTPGEVGGLAFSAAAP